MADIGHEHLHHMAKRLHHITTKHEGMIAKISGAATRVIDTIETSGGAWLGGTIEGRSDGAAFLGVVPWNLLLGIGFLAAGHIPIKALHGHTTHFDNLGNGLIASYAAAVGYKFGANWRKDGGWIPKLWGAHSFHPYELPGGGTDVKGDLSEQQMASIVQRMQQAAASQ